MERMRAMGQLADPREHLGYRATYKAGTWWQRWPLDHVLHDDAFVVVDGATHPPFGSDHLAWHVDLCTTHDDDGLAAADDRQSTRAPRASRPPRR
jgi:endonuclease/exonuclease/phosphatase (EEP) superfamily protein YafD